MVIAANRRCGSHDLHIRRILSNGITDRRFRAHDPGPARPCLELTDMHRVVLADDVGELRALVRLTLERSGQFEVVAEAGNGQEAIDAVSHEQPDLVLLDVSMPVMDGLEALPQILRAAPDVTVVMLSGFAEERIGDEARRLGATAYLEKGVPPRELVARLLAVLGEGPA